ncbi:MULTISPECIES: hypothetical protein [Methylosinus]|uniref:Uncharacterized protein n=1 Tax=Methylosinus trichosporium (strain ATCC 35070 / NCIMB 11131 / UNIQEM 75 / OB3b) TaxID=595536 RepID=A0A2D2CY93_METT3|nr:MULTISPECIES: hypothetical protein [Methylosinus]ATQ67720.1 hypothetical protein CQW49_07320 [Methylosinus trichosporium OB3b]OBS51172.1 hypothetical protein A8B73_17790 [Methylosinus sp. 3S-1]
MTTTITITSHNYPVLVETVDRTQTPNGEHISRHVRVLWPEDGAVGFYSTTSRSIFVRDMEYDDPRAVADRAARFPVAVA